MDDRPQVFHQSGISRRELSSADAYLGVSFSMTRYFSRARMRQYAEWAGANVAHLLIIVADHFEGYNIQVFKKVPATEAFPRAFKAGNDLLRGYFRAIPEELRGRVRLVLASELLIEEGCKRILGAVRELAASQGAFRRDCRAGVVEMIAGKLDEAGLHGAARAGALDLLDNYMYEEIAIILYVAHAMEPKWPVAIFPYEPRKVITNIYEGVYGRRLLEITRNEPFRFVKLAAPSFEAGRMRTGAEQENEGGSHGDAIVA